MRLSVDEGDGDVFASDRSRNPIEGEEVDRLLDECARLGKENAALRSLLGEWHALFAPVRREGTEAAQLLDLTEWAITT